MVARAIAAQQLPCVITVTTETARALYPLVSSLTVWVGVLTPESLPAFLQRYQIAAIVDASHPFAIEISQRAIAAAAQFNLPYLRYERPPLPEIGQFRQEESAPGKLLTLDSFQTLVSGEYLQQQRVLLTVGYRALALFKSWQTQATLFARILPSATALEAASEAGFTPDRIIALRPPISTDLERALWKQWHITMVVTKASGVAGGEDVKRQVAAELGVRLVAITRPEMSYPQQTSDPRAVVVFCIKILAPH